MELMHVHVLTGGGGGRKDWELNVYNYHGPSAANSMCLIVVQDAQER